MVLIKKEELLLTLGKNRKAELRKYAKFHKMSMNETARRAIDEFLSFPHEEEKPVQVGNGFKQDVKQ